MNRVGLVFKIARNSRLNRSSKTIEFECSLKPRPNYSTATLSMPRNGGRLIAWINSDYPLLRGSLIIRPESTIVDIKEEIDHIVKNNKVVLFMKGVPDAPKCGFSNAVCQILRMHGVEYDSHDVLEDESLRKGIKEYSQWPTIPQVFINGQFVGGCDVLLQLHQSGDLIEELEKAGIKSALLENAEK